MTELVVIGGFGSSQSRTELVANTIGEHTDQRAMGYNFRNASQQIERLAYSIDGNRVITHSGGLKMAAQAILTLGARPESITAVAPTVPEQIPHLLCRAARLGIGLRQTDDELREKLGKDGSDLSKHPVANLRHLAELAQFDAFDAGATFQEMDIETTLAMMDDDDLFNYESDTVGVAVRRARRVGAKVVSLLGNHNRFMRHPVAIYDEIDSRNRNTAWSYLSPAHPSFNFGVTSSLPTEALKV